MRRERVTLPVDTPIAIDEVKANLAIEDNLDDSLIERCIASATAYAENYTGRHIMLQTWRYYYDSFSSRLPLHSVPVVSVSALKYFDPDGLETTLIADADYYSVLSGSAPFLAPVNSWPQHSIKPFGISVEVVSGYADAGSVPEGIKTAIHLMVGHLLNNREGTSDRKVNTVPMGVESFLDQYRVF